MMLKALASRGLRALLVLLFGAVVIQHAILRFELSTRLLGFSLSPQTTALTLTVLACAALALILPLRWRAPDRWSRLAGILGLLALLLVIPFSFLAENFGYVDLETVLIVAGDMPVGDAAGVAALDFVRPMAEVALATAITIIAALYLMRRMPGFVPALFLLAIVGIVTSQPATYLYRRIFPDPAMKLVSLADLSPPVVQTAPTRFPNLVIVILESVERSYRDIPATADAFSGFAKLEDQGFSARNVGQIKGTHYSVAGHVASLCGIPMYPRGLQDPKKVKSAEDAEKLGISSFLPGTTCLGDILSNYGYETSYINGADANTFAIADLMKNHGFTTVRGLQLEPEHANAPSNNSWGVPDSEVFKVAKEELGRFSRNGRPFALVLATSSTHGPSGYLDPGCDYSPPIKPHVADSKIPATIQCSGKLVENLISDLKQADLYDNTMVVLLSDHLAMANTLIKELKSVENRRRNYFVILNSPKDIDGTISDRAATMMDIFPTMIEAMGFTLKDGAGNLGHSLLSPAPTLAEKLGLDIVDRALFGNQEIRRSVWTPK